MKIISLMGTGTADFWQEPGKGWPCCVEAVRL